MLIAEYVSIHPKEENMVTTMYSKAYSNLRILTVATSIEKIITNTTTVAIQWRYGR